MTNFDELLKKSLSVVNDGYQIACNDVGAIVDKLGKAIKQNAGDQFGFEMSEVQSDVKGVTFRIYLDPDSNDINAALLNIAHIRIPSKGYPIFYGVFNKSSNVFAAADKLENAEEVAEYFSDFLKDPESPLIQAIGYVLRKKANK